MTKQSKAYKCKTMTMHKIKANGRIWGDKNKDIDIKFYNNKKMWVKRRLVRTSENEGKGTKLWTIKMPRKLKLISGIKSKGTGGI
jgi:hypothetical protein